MHPARPMLQAHFYSSTGKRELAQAICSLSSTPKGECLHISQLWCLVVNGSTMVTCSRQNITALCGETIAKSVSPISQHQVQLKVNMGSDRSWMIPVTPETSWPQFLASFGEKVAGMEAQGASAMFEYNKQAVDGKLWHEIIETAKASTVELTMHGVQFHVKEEDEQMIENQTEVEDEEELSAGADDGPVETVSEPDRGISPAPQSVEPTASIPLEPNLTLQLFKHVGGTAEMRKLADSLHKILLSNERHNENTAYRQCPKAKPSDITTWLRSDSRRAETTLDSRESLMLRKPKRRIVLVAKYMFYLFWPVDFEHPMTERFWGALRRILSRDDEFYVEVR